MKVTVFVPIQMEIKGEDKLVEVINQLMVINDIVIQSELESDPRMNIDLVGEAEILEDVEE